MKVGESKIQDLTLSNYQADRAVKKDNSLESANIAKPKENGLESKNASFVGDVKAMNEMMIGIGLTENSLQKVSNDKMEEAVKDLRNITSTLKDILARNFATTNENKGDYTAEAVKTKLYGTNPSNLHNFDYLASKATSLLA